MTEDDFLASSEMLWKIRSEREQLHQFCYLNGIRLAPYWHPDQRFTAPPVYTPDFEDLAHTLVLVMTLDHPEVEAFGWKCVRSGLFRWSGNLTLVERAGEMGDCHNVKRKRGSKWILIEAPPERMNEWRWEWQCRPWSENDWPKLLLPECPVAA